MKQIAAALLSIGFVLGVIVFPALHKANCAPTYATTGASNEQHSGGCNGEAPASHDSGNCPVCQLAGTPLIIAPTLTAPAMAITAAETISLPTALPSIRVSCLPHLARGPPNA